MTTLAKLAQAGYLACGLLLLAGPVMAQEKAVPDFATFLQGVKAEAAGKGMRPETLETALANVEHIDKVIELDRRQPEFTMTYKTYMDRVVSPTKVEKGRLMLAENHAVLAHIEREYGVQPKYVVALWGSRPIMAGSPAVIPSSRPWPPWPMTVAVPPIFAAS